MVVSSETKKLRAKHGDPVWGVIEFLPGQGAWSEQQYMDLVERRGIEFTDGNLEFLPMPTDSHQAMMGFLFVTLLEFVRRLDLGKVRAAGIRIRLRDGKFREPDISFMKKAHLNRITEKCWIGADLVMEVVTSPEGRERDLKGKPAVYAEAGISEYWIVDPKVRTITVLKLSGKKYVPHGVFREGQRASSALLKGFFVDVSAVFNAD